MFYTQFQAIECLGYGIGYSSMKNRNHSKGAAHRCRDAILLPSNVYRCGSIIASAFRPYFSDGPISLTHHDQLQMLTLIRCHEAASMRWYRDDE